MIKPWIVAASLLLAGNANAFAADPVWHWDVFGTSGYSGQVNLRDDQGNAINYQRYDASGSPALFGSASVQSPMMVVAGTDMQIDILRSGVVATKKTCTGSSTWKVYVVPVTACNLGSGTNIGGIHAWAENTSATTWTPRLAVYVQGYGWRQVNNNTCGNVQAQQLCE